MKIESRCRYFHRRTLIGNCFAKHQTFYLGLNSLWPSDPIWWHSTGSTLAQVMACCLTTPSHYLDQCWLIISKALCHSYEGIMINISEDTNQWYYIKNVIFKIRSRYLRDQWVNVWNGFDALCMLSHVIVPPHTMMSAWWLLMSWCLFCSRTSATIMVKLAGS